MHTTMKIAIDESSIKPLASIKRRHMTLITLLLNIFVAAISPATAFDEFLLDQLQQQSVHCAGQSTHEFSCTSGLCYDSFHLKTKNVTSGCASPKTCTQIGCNIDKKSNTFVCCCSHSFCNGKSAKMVRKRWEMFESDNYQPLSAHNNESNIATIERRSLSKHDVATFDSPSKTSTVKILKTTQPIESANVTNENVSTTPNLNITTATRTISLTTPTSKAASTQTVSNELTNKSIISQLATTKASNITIDTTLKTAVKSVRKFALKVTKSPAIRVNSSRSGTRRVTLRAPYIIAKSLNATAKLRNPITKISKTTTAITATATTLKPTTILTTTLKTTIPDTISEMSDAPATIDNNMKLPEYKPRNVLIKTKTTSTVAQNTTITNDARPLVILPSLNEEALIHRTTLLPTPSTTIMATAPRRRQSTDYRTFPWYFVVILGIAVSAAIFALIFILFRQFYPQMRNLTWHASPGDSLQHIKEEHSINSSSVDAENAGDYTAYSNGSLRALSSVEQSSAMLLDSQKQKSEPKRASIFNAFRHSKHDPSNASKTTKNNAYQRGALIKASTVKGMTNESLASHCTTITTLSSDLSAPQPLVKSSVKEKHLRHKCDEDRELTVIDPLINKQYTGTIHISAPPAPLLSDGRH